jgi:hypothetical protein
VVEVASMLGNEPFSDRPACVCPALRAFLHGYNDNLPDDLRQELYGLASDIVGTRTPALITAWRARLCIDWARSLAAIAGVSPRFRGWTLENCELAGASAALMARRDPWSHRQTLAFIHWLAHARSPRDLRAGFLVAGPPAAGVLAGVV